MLIKRIIAAGDNPRAGNCELPLKLINQELRIITESELKFMNYNRRC